MTDELTKTQTSITALKNANKHLTELIQANENMSRIMGTVASDLTSHAAKCGELIVLAWSGTEWKHIKFKDHLNALAAILEKGRL